MAIYTQKLYQTNTDIQAKDDNDYLNFYYQSFTPPAGANILDIKMYLYVTSANTNASTYTTGWIYKESTSTRVGTLPRIYDDEVNRYYSAQISSLENYYRIILDTLGYGTGAILTIADKDSSNPAYLEVRYALGNEPTKPDNFSAIQSGTDINISFDYVGSGQTNDSMTGYEIQYRIGGGTWQSIEVSGTNTNYTLNSSIFDGTTGNVNIEIRVRTKNNLTTTYSEWSDTVSLTYASKNPSQPTNFTATQNAGVVNVSWTYQKSSDGTDVQSGADIQYSFDTVNWNTLSHTGDATTYTIAESILNDTTVTNRTVYVRVRTKNNLGGISAFTDAIQINYKTSKPVAPGNLQPFGQQLQGEITATWQFNHTGRGDTQKAFELMYKCEGQEWQTVSGTTASEYAFSDLAAGTVLWKVRVQSTLNVWSDWSTEASFIYAVPPEKPVITSPNQFDISKPTITWESQGQTSFRLQVLKDTEVYFDTQEVASSATSYTLEKALENDSTYVIKLRIKNRFALWSEWAEQSISTSFREPNQPSFSLLSNSQRASIHLSVSNPIPEEISKNEVFRRRFDEVEWTLLGEVEVNGSFVDYTINSDTQYEYKVRAVTEDGGYKDSEIQNISVKVRNTQLANTADYNEWVELVYNPAKTFSKNYTKKLVHYAGRRNPAIITSPEQTWKMNLSFTIIDRNVLESLLNLIDKQEILLLRDSKGRNKYVFVTQDPQINEKYEPQLQWEVSFEVTEVDFDD